MSELKLRKGVVGVFTMQIGSELKILMCQRSDNPLAWQLPQGGIEPLETPKQAFIREMHEELGTQNFDILGFHDQWISYYFPKEIQLAIAKKFDGQSHLWFKAVFHTNQGPDFAKSDGEFTSSQWLLPQQALDLVVNWKRSAYFEGFKALQLI